MNHAPTGGHDWGPGNHKNSSNNTQGSKKYTILTKLKLRKQYTQRLKTTTTQTQSRMGSHRHNNQDAAPTQTSQALLRRA